MDVIASQITSLTIVYSTFYQDADQRKHKSSTSLAFVRGLHRGLVNSPHKGPATWEMFPFDDVTMSIISEYMSLIKFMSTTCDTAIWWTLITLRLQEYTTHCRLYFIAFFNQIFKQYVFMGHIDNTSALMQVMACCIQWLHNERDGISNHWRFDCVLNCLFRCRSKRTSKLLITGLWERNPSGFRSQRASNVENVSNMMMSSCEPILAKLKSMMWFDVIEATMK